MRQSARLGLYKELPVVRPLRNSDFESRFFMMLLFPASLRAIVRNVRLLCSSELMALKTKLFSWN